LEINAVALVGDGGVEPGSHRFEQFVELEGVFREHEINIRMMVCGEHI
jgi:hypothetical protein